MAVGHLSGVPPAKPGAGGEYCCKDIVPIVLVGGVKGSFSLRLIHP